MAGYIFMASNPELIASNCYAIGYHLTSNLMEISKKTDLSNIYFIAKVENASDSLNLLIQLLNIRYEPVQQTQLNRNQQPDLYFYMINKHEFISEIKEFLTDNKQIFKDNAIDKIHEYPTFISKWMPSIIFIGLLSKSVLYPIYKWLF